MQKWNHTSPLAKIVNGTKKKSTIKTTRSSKEVQWVNPHRLNSPRHPFTRIQLHLSNYRLFFKIWGINTHQNKICFRSFKNNIIHVDHLLRPPYVLVSDNGTEFDNHVIEALNKSIGIRHITTTPYHPQSNGQCERLNRTIYPYIKTLIDSSKNDLTSALPFTQIAYNTTRQCITCTTPYLSVFFNNPTSLFHNLLLFRFFIVFASMSQTHPKPSWTGEAYPKHMWN